MRTTVNLEPEAYRLARAIASQRKTTLGHVLSEAILGQLTSPHQPCMAVLRNEAGFPSIYIGRVITPEEVALAIEEE